jgi:hypothetical protein
MNTKLADQIIETMRNKTTEELLEIWLTNDRGQWSDTAFDAVHQTLSERNVIIPSQNAAITSSLISERYQGVRGWLRFFCITLTVFFPLSIIAAPLCGNGSIMDSMFWLATLLVSGVDNALRFSAKLFGALSAKGSSQLAIRPPIHRIGA